MGRHGHRGGRKHRDRSPASSDDDSLDGHSNNNKSSTTATQQQPNAQQQGNGAGVMNILTAAMPNLRSAHNRGGTGPLWKNDQVHIWRKDNVTIVNLRNEKETLPGLDSVMRQRETLPVPPRKEISGAASDSPAAAQGLPRNGTVHRTAAPPPPPPPPAAPRAPDENGSSIQAYLKEQLNRMHSKEPIPMLAANQLALGPRQPDVPPPAPTAPSPPPATIQQTLFGDPMWSSASWDAFDSDSSKKESATKGVSEAEKQTLDALSGILGDLRGDAPATPGGSIPPAPIAAVGTSTPPTPPFSVQQGPWTVAAPGMTSPQGIPVAAMHAAPMLQAGMKQPHPMPQQMPQQVFMGPNGVQYVAAYAAPQGFSGFPVAGMMPGQPMMYPQGMQIVQAPQGWTMAQQPGKQMVPAGFQQMPAPAGVKTLTMDEYNRLIQQQMQAQQQHQLNQQMVMQQQMQQQQQLRTQEMQQQSSGGFTVSGSSDGNEPRNASANGVNISARPFVPPRK